PNHLISAGHIGYHTTLDRQVWLAIQRLAEIDYCDAHAYPQRDPRVRTREALGLWIDDRVQLAHHVAGKPIVFGEIGFAGERRGPAWRASRFDRFLTQVFRDGAAGALVWIYSPYLGRERSHGIYPIGAVSRRYRAIRRVLSRHASRIARRPPRARNPRLGEAQGARPLFARLGRLRGHGRWHDRWRPEPEAGILGLRIDPFAYYDFRFERGDEHRAEASSHLWGLGQARLRYRFRAPPGLPEGLSLEVRASADLPGSSETSTQSAEISLRIDGVELGRAIAPPDDGRGLPIRFEFEAAALAPVFARSRARHVLELRLERGTGLCVYAQAPDASPSPLFLRWEPARAPRL
ncbi:MAG: hypothetical protein OEY14_01975, partial [Myxococcales bacterium]|nr:hypothetical protein [Myxococcales bacterium]